MGDSELDDWLDRIDDVSKTINGLVDGTITDAECDATLDRVTRPAKRIAEAAPAPTFRSGPGHSDSYAIFCRGCNTEHIDDVSVCANCGQADVLETRQARQAYLRSRVDDLMKDREQRIARRQRWRRYIEHRRQKRASDTDYQRWDAWEPDTDSDDEPVPDRDDPRFAALEADMVARERQRAEKQARADAFKREGNECFAKRRYVQAADLYTKAIEAKKDGQEYYTNRALAYIRTQQYTKALIDCDTVLDMAEFLDGNRFPRNRPVVFKAWMRRASALRGLRRIQDAIDALDNGALRCRPDAREALDLIAACRRDIRELDREKRVRAQGGYTDLQDALNATDLEKATTLMQAGGDDVRVQFRVLKGVSKAVSVMGSQPIDACNALIEACHGNPYNVEVVSQAGTLVEDLVTCLDRQSSSPDHAKAMLSLLLSLSSLSEVRHRLIDDVAGDKTWRALRRWMEQDQAMEVRAAAIALLGNLALESRFRSIIAGTSPITHRLLAVVSNRGATDDLKERAVAALGNLLLNDRLRTQLATHEDPRAFQVLVGAVKRSRKAGPRQRNTLEKMLSVVVNLVADPVGLERLHQAGMVPVLCNILQPGQGALVQERCLQSLARLCSVGVDDSLDAVLPVVWSVVSGLMEKSPVLDHGVRAMAALSKSDRFANILYACTDQKQVPACLVRIGSVAAGDVQVIGNLALCVSRLLDASKGGAEVADGLLGLIPVLVDVVSNSNNAVAARRNAAIAAAKLSKFPNAMAQLRELRAVEMLMATAGHLLAAR
ncbi:unnamed protein product (mitochondrion) [Plasmodiophora brassicae]|uniref:Uncharacterized protein n=1 Tax=Plasmodiophora brassicae TaxID=37360 RepID=A0A0G4IYH3_PLABS|nr:hypothetical protein PBRA_008036 [Plasmodiophora brassicae]SPQ95083.1 unnamed protein product [Plasmodiophora brassicae]